MFTGCLAPATLLFAVATIGTIATTPTSQVRCTGCLTSVDWRPSHLAVQMKATAVSAAEVIATARTYLGAPYSWGGTGTHGFDCSGFVNKVYAANGYDLPRVSRQQMLVGLVVPPAKLRMGDLLFFSRNASGGRITHVGIYIETGEFIHASEARGEVTYSSLSESYFNRRLAAARRILVLPPGRYSDLVGGAVGGMLFAQESSASAYAAVARQMSPADRLAPMATTATAAQPDLLLIEHPERPWYQPEPLAVGTTSVGPAMLEPPASRLQARLGAGRLNSHSYLLALVGLSYFDQDSSLRMDAAMPFLYTPSVPLALVGPWQNARDIARILRRIAIGNKDANGLVDLSRTQSVSVGWGQVMRYFTPNIQRLDVPEYVLRQNALTLTGAVSLNAGGVELTVDDALDPAITAIGLTVKPFSHKQSDPTVSLTWATDWRAPDGEGVGSIHGVGGTVQTTVARGDGYDLRIFADVSGLLHRRGHGLGIAAGAQWRAFWSNYGNQHLGLRVEGRLSESTYLPTYFDVFYALQRRRVPGPQGSPTVGKLALLQTMESQPGRWSLYSELIYQLQRRVCFGASYEDGGHVQSWVGNGAVYSPRSMMFFLRLQEIYLGTSRHSFNLDVAYHLRNSQDLVPFVQNDNGQEYFFSTASVDLTDIFLMAVTVTKSLSGANTLSADWNATIDVAAQWSF